MSLMYIEYPMYKDKIKNLYLDSFPEKERFPFWLLEECSKENNSYLYAILDDEKFIGMSYIVNCNDAYYLMYLAVEPDLRNKKYGSNILQDLKEKYKTIFLSIERSFDEISIKRKKFYLKNGFYDTNKIYEDAGVYYEVLCTNNEYIVTDDSMLKRYINMSNNSDLLDVISNTFNTNAVNLKNKSEL